MASAAGSVPSVALGQSDVTVGLAAIDSAKPTNLSSASVLVIKAKGATWVSISDARGVTQVSKMLALDEVVSSGGPLPLSVVVGRSDRAEATVRGNAFDMKATAKENVARFQVR